MPSLSGRQDRPYREHYFVITSLLVFRTHRVRKYILMLLQIPSEITLEILHHLNAPDVARCRAVRASHNLAHHRALTVDADVLLSRGTGCISIVVLPLGPSRRTGELREANCTHCG